GERRDQDDDCRNIYDCRSDGPQRDAKLRDRQRSGDRRSRPTVAQGKGQYRALREANLLRSSRRRGIDAASIIGRPAWAHVFAGEPLSAFLGRTLSTWAEP